MCDTFDSARTHRHFLLLGDKKSSVYFVDILENGPFIVSCVWRCVAVCGLCVSVEDRTDLFPHFYGCRLCYFGTIEALFLFFFLWRNDMGSN